MQFSCFLFILPPHTKRSELRRSLVLFFRTKWQFQTERYRKSLISVNFEMVTWNSRTWKNMKNTELFQNTQKTFPWKSSNYAQIQTLEKCMHDAESPSWSDASKTRLQERKKTSNDGHLTRTSEIRWEFMCFFENGKNCTSAALHAYVLRIYSDDAELASDFGVRLSALLLCCGINARNQVEKTRLSSEKRDIKMWVSGHTWNRDWWVVGHQKSGQKSVEMKKISHFLCVRPQRVASKCHAESAIFWTLRRTQLRVPSRNTNFRYVCIELTFFLARH